MPKTDAAGVSLIENFEGLRLVAYQDSVGVWTIGFGHTGSCAAIGKGDVCAGMMITRAQAQTLLQSDLAFFENGVNNLLARSVNPNQFAALVSFAYNVGIGALAHSTLLALVNDGNDAAAAQQFSVWVWAGGVRLFGLVRRRAAEAALFCAPCVVLRAPYTAAKAA